MTATETLEHRIDELCAEVERLRQQVDTAKHNQTRNAREYARLCHENDRLLELVRDYHTFLALADLAQPIGHIIAASGHPTLSVESLDRRYRELGIEVDA